MADANPQREALVMAREALAGYESWEAALIESADAWAPEGMADLPRFTEPLWDALMELQAKRNNIMEAIDAALAAPVGGDTDNALGLDGKPIDWRTAYHEMNKRESELYEKFEAAIEWITNVGAELADAGFPRGDRTVSLASIRQMIRERPTPTQDGGDG